MNLFKALNPGDTGLTSGRFPMLPPPLLDTSEMQPRGATSPPPYEEGMVPPLKTQQGTKIDQRTPLSRSGQFTLRKYLIGGISENSQPACHCRDHTGFPTLDLPNRKNTNNSYREDPQKITDLIISIFAAHHPNWADVQTL